MQIKLSDLFSAKPTLDGLLELDLPFLTSYKVARLAARLRDEFAAAESARIKVFSRHGTEKDGKITVPLDKSKELEADLKLLQAEEVEVDVKPLPASLFKSVPTLKPKFLTGLGPFISWDMEAD